MEATMYRITIHDKETLLDSQMVFADSCFEEVFSTMHDLTKNLPESEMQMAWVKDKQETYLVGYFSGHWKFWEDAKQFLN